MTGTTHQQENQRGSEEVAGVTGAISPLRFLVISLLFFLLVACLPENFLAPVNHATAALAGHCLALFRGAVSVAGDLILLDGFRVRIVTECTALYSMIIFTSFVLANPAPWRRLVSGLLAGWAIINVVNLFRIAGVIAVGADYPAYFEAVHVYLGQVVMLLLVLGLAVAWQRCEFSCRVGNVSFLLRAFALATLIFPVWLVCNRAYVMGIDRLVTALFALSGHDIFIPHRHSVNFQTFNLVLLVALLGAEQRLRLQQKLCWLLVGVVVLASGHLLFRVGNVLLTAFDWSPALQLSITLTVCGEYLLPLIFWLLAVRGSDAGIAWSRLGKENPS